MNMTRTRFYMAMTATFLLGAVLAALIAVSLVRVSTANAAPPAGNQGLICPGCNFSGAGNRFAGANFTGAVLDYATFGPYAAFFRTENAHLGVGADLTGATFKQASLIGAQFSTTTLDNVSFNGAIVCGPGSNVDDSQTFQFRNTTSFFRAHGSNVDFRNLQFVTLGAFPCTAASINVGEAVFHNANFKGTSVLLSGNADFTGSNFNGALLHTSQLDGANFTGANLRNTSFRDNNPQAASLSGANFTNADFTGANLESTIGLDSATLTGAVWSNTICPDGTNSNNDGGTCMNNLTSNNTGG